MSPRQRYARNDPCGSSEPVFCQTGADLDPVEHAQSSSPIPAGSLEERWVASDTEPSAWNVVEGSGRVVIRHRHWAFGFVRLVRPLSPSLTNQLSTFTRVGLGSVGIMPMQGTFHGVLRRAAPTSRQ